MRFWSLPRLLIFTSFALITTRSFSSEWMFQCCVLSVVRLIRILLRLCLIWIFSKFVIAKLCVGYLAVSMAIASAFSRRRGLRMSCTSSISRMRITI